MMEQQTSNCAVHHYTGVAHCSISGADQQADWSTVRIMYAMSLLKLYKTKESKGL